MSEKKKVPDKSPENDLKKAAELLRNARAKYIPAGNEARAERMLQAINDLQKE